MCCPYAPSGCPLSPGRGDVEGAFLAVGDEARWRSFDATDVTALGVVHGDGGGMARGAGRSGQGCCRLQDVLRHGRSGRADDDVRAGHAAGVEPEVVRARLAEGQLVVAAPALPDEDFYPADDVAVETASLVVGRPTRWAVGRSG